MDDLITFLRARLDEREKVALAACGELSAGRWRQEDPNREPGRIEDDLNDVVTYDEGSPTGEQARHIADNDPAFVLADVAAKRQIIAMHERGVEYLSNQEYCCKCATGDSCDDCLDYSTQVWPCSTLRLLALPYAGHPDYREEWKP